MARICFQVEEAQWFYEDFIRPLDPNLPSMSLRTFCLRIFQHCPLLSSFSAENHMRAFEEFLQYKTRVPVRGAILLNEAMDSTVLVKGWKKGASWSFPRGKINKDEDDLDCAIREVYEETGFDIKQAGLVPKAQDVKAIEVVMREQQIRLYVFRNIPMHTNFQPKTRKEISKIEWYKLSALPAFRKRSNQVDDAAAASNANKFYMVAPFLVPLKKWVVEQKQKDRARTSSGSHLAPSQEVLDETLTEDDGMQTETGAGLSTSPPAIETMEGATLELQRLLKVQPPTQGMQMKPPSAFSQDKGEALMALLRQKSSDPPGGGPVPPPPSVFQTQVPQPQVPHTPLDHTYAAAPQPHNPHHQHSSQHHPVQNYQAAPNFPLNHHVSQPPPPASNFNYTRPHVNIAPQGPMYSQNPYANQRQPMRKEPVLLHPQPLPPQVQQHVLARGILPTPDAINQGFAQPQFPAPNSYPPNQPGVLQPQQQGPAKMPAQLSGHKMSLLNAFMNDNKQSGENKAPAPAPQNPPPAPAVQHPAQYGSPSWANQVSAQAPNAAAQYLPHYMGGLYTQTPPESAQPKAAGSPGSHAPVPRQAQPADAHRSSLLDMFKKTGPLSPTSSDSTVRHNSARTEPAFAAKGASNSPASKQPSNAEAIARAAEANGSPVRMNPEVNLPYRALTILSRQKQPGSPKSAKEQFNQAMHAQNSKAGSPHSTYSAQHEAKAAEYHSNPSPRERSFPRHVDNHNHSPRFSLAAQAAGLPYGHSPQQTVYGGTQAGSASQAGSTSQSPLATKRRQDANPEQKQKLLSLFAKASASPTGFTTEEKVKFKDPSILEQARPRSRVASLASAGGENVQGSAPISRRGSGTPISPADRNFLLSFLESVSSGGR